MFYRLAFIINVPDRRCRIDPEVVVVRKGQAASDKSGPKGKVAVSEGKEKKRSRKKERKALKGGEAGGKARGQRRGQRAQLATGRNKQLSTSSTTRRPRVEGWVPTSTEKKKK